MMLHSSELRRDILLLQVLGWGHAFDLAKGGKEGGFLEAALLAESRDGEAAIFARSDETLELCQSVTVDKLIVVLFQVEREDLT